VNASRYELHDEFARGGMATVHFGKLRGANGFSQMVAIKRLHAALADDEEGVASFLNEARIASRIRHPHVVSVLDVAAQRGELFLVMEYVHGESLAALLRPAPGSASAPPVPPAIASAIFAGVLEGLHAAHEAKDEGGQPLDIVHRDVSPQNVLVGADGLARLVDFGIAKAASRGVTREGVFKGKLAYAAPEQLRAERLSRLADVYAASVSLWEALTGRTLFSGADPAALLASVLTSTREPPSVYAPGLTAAVDGVVLRGMDRDRTRRFATTHEMAMELTKALAPASPSTVAAWLEGRASETLGKRMSLLSAVERRAEVAQPEAPDDDAPDAVTIVRAPRATAPAKPASGRARFLLPLVVVGAALVLASLAALRSPGVVLATPPVVADAAAPQTAAPRTVPHDEEPAPPASAPLAAPAGGAAVAPSRGRARPKAPPAPSPSPGGDPCDPPFTLDKANHKVFRPSCLLK
jgi:eukaryotic-like serine/threonine-protein kinase